MPVGRLSVKHVLNGVVISSIVMGVQQIIFVEVVLSLSKLSSDDTFFM